MSAKPANFTALQSMISLSNQVDYSVSATEYLLSECEGFLLILVLTVSSKWLTRNLRFEKASDI